MNIFISWSGTSSKEIAEILRNWLPSVLQNTKPYFSPYDIGRGTRWSSEIAKELESSQVGLICLTPTNLESTWVMFEAGALSKNIDESRIFPLLFGIKANEIPSPLLQFQATSFEKTEVFALIETINSMLGSYSLSQKVLEKTFEVWWPLLEKDINSINITSNYDLVRKDDKQAETLSEIANNLVELRNAIPGLPAMEGVSATAFNHLVVAYCDLIDLNCSDSNTVDAMEKLDELYKPIAYLAKRMQLLEPDAVIRLNSVPTQLYEAAKNS